MSKIIFLLLSLLSAEAVLSQPNKDSLYKLMAVGVCDEVKANESSLARSTDLQMDLGLLMLPIFSRHESDLKAVIPGFELDNMNLINEVSHGIGQKLAFMCPAFLKLVSGNKDLLKAATDKTEENSFTGTLTKILSENFTCLLIKDNKGKIEKIWWMQYFEGANVLASGELLHKNITVFYSEQEIYNAVLKDYVKIKVIKGIKD